MSRVAKASKFAVAALLTATCLSGAALAASQTATGTIKALDAKDHTLTLDSGKSFSLPKNMKTSGLKTGEKVKITFETTGGKLVASKVRPEK